MSSKLPWSEVIDIVEEYKDSIPDNGVLRVNHDTDYCNGSSKSMTIRRDNNDGGIRINCFRCGKWNSYNQTFHRHNKAKENYNNGVAQKQHTPSNNELPPERDCNFDTWPREARNWILRHGIKVEELHGRGISVHNNRLIIPVYIGGDLVGYQSRKLVEDGSPKYITKTNDPSRMLYFVSNNRSKIVIVEDFLSAIKVGRFFDAVAIMGTELSTWGLRYITNTYQDYVIALDNDNVIVKRKQQKLKRALQDFGNVRVCYLSCDPKELTDEKILEIFS